MSEVLASRLRVCTIDSGRRRKRAAALWAGSLRDRRLSPLSLAVGDRAACGRAGAAGTCGTLPCDPATHAGAIPCSAKQFRTELCQKVLASGHCHYGDRCTFLHPESVATPGLDILRSAARPFLQHRMAVAYGGEGFAVPTTPPAAASEG